MATTTSCTVMLLFHHIVPQAAASSYGRGEAGEGDDLFGPVAEGLGVLTPQEI